MPVPAKPPPPPEPVTPTPPGIDLPDWMAPQEFVFAKWLAGIFSPFFDQLWKTYRTAVGKLMAYVAVWSFRSAMSIRPDMMRNTFAHCFEKFLAYDTEWTQAVRAYFKFVTNVDPGPIDVGHLAQIASENIGEHFLNPMLNLVLPTGFPVKPTGKGLTPEQGLDGAERFLGVNLRFQMQSWLMSFVSDFMGVDWARSISNLPNQISWAYGIGWLSWLVMGVPFRLAISEPLERYFQNIYRTKDLTLSQIAELYWTKPEFQTAATTMLKELGYPDDFLAFLLNKERYKFSSSEMENLYHQGRIGFNDIVDELKAGGKSPEQANELARLLVNKRWWNLIEDLATEAATQYKKGTVTQGELRNYLADAGFEFDEIALRIARLDLARLEPEEAEPTPRHLSMAQIGGLYRDGERDWDWVLRKLTKYMWNPDEVDDFKDIYKPKEEKPPTPKRATAAMIGKLYKTRQLTELEARKEWAEAGVIAEDVDLYVKYYAPTPEWPEEFKLPVPMKPTTIASLYKQMWITLEEGVYLLGLLDVERDNALLYLALYAPPQAAAPPERPELGVYEIVQAVAKELASLEEGISRLVERGWDRDEAYTYLRVQVAYQVAADVYLDCLGGEITYQEALNKMVSWGWTPRDAEIYLKAHGCG